MAGRSGGDFSSRTHPVTQPAIVRDVLPNGLRLLTERMPHVRSVSIGVWLARGSRHETRRAERHRPLRRAHALQGHRHAHGRGHRADDRLDRRPDGRVHREGIRELLHQGARRASAACRGRAVRHRHATRRSADEDIEREKKVVARRDQDGRGHAGRPRPRAVHREFLGRTIRWAGRFSARKDTVESLDAGRAAPLFREHVHARRT